MLTIVTDTFAPNDTAPIAIPVDARRTRRYHKPGPLLAEQKFRFADLDGEPVVYVKLHGRGYGKEMLLDATDWPFVRDLGVAAWTLAGHTRGHVGYVCSGVAAVRHLAPGSTAACPLVVLARVLTGASKDDNVRYQNRDTLDLRRHNLAVVSRKDFLADLGVARDGAIATA